MDLTKFALYTSLAIITYLMLLAWQKDYPPLIDDGIAQKALPATDPNTSSAETNDLPTQMPSSSQPDLQQTSGSSNAATQTEPLTKYIDIQTDTLELSIDLIGGDIVSLSLPKYLKQIDVADDPFKLLENSLGVATSRRVA